MKYTIIGYIFTSWIKNGETNAGTYSHSGFIFRMSPEEWMRNIVRIIYIFTFLYFYINLYLSEYKSISLDLNVTILFTNTRLPNSLLTLPTHHPHRIVYFTIINLLNIFNLLPGFNLPAGTSGNNLIAKISNLCTGIPAVYLKKTVLWENPPHTCSIK